MASSLPIIRQVAWLSVVPQVLLLLTLIVAARVLTLSEPILVGSLTYLTLLVFLRNAIPRHHRRGMRFFKRERFKEAIPQFRLSYQFFVKHHWVDRWRALTMLSSSRISYREMALLNLAFSLAQTGDHEQALAEYQRALAEFPDSKVAQMSIRMLSATTANETKSQS